MTVQFGQLLEITRETCDRISRRGDQDWIEATGCGRAAVSERPVRSPGVGTGADPESTSGKTTRRAGGRQCDASDTSRGKSLRDRMVTRGVAEANIRSPSVSLPRFTEEPMDKPTTVNRRNFLGALGVTVGGTGLAGAGMVAGPQLVKAATEPPKGKIPDTPYKTGHMTFLTGPAAVLGEPSIKGHMLAAEEINAKGGLLGKRKNETITADEAAGTDANVKELRRMKLEGKIDLFTGIISSGNSPALAPVAEELGVMTIFTDGCTDFVFDVADPNPKYVFRITNIQSADGITAAIATAQAWPQVRKIAHIHPDYSYGRNAAEHFTLAIERLLPGTEMVSEAWPKLGTTDFTAHITKALSSQADLLYTSLWGGDYIAFYKQPLRYGLFEKMKLATTLAFGVASHANGKDHPEGAIAGVHSNYHFTYPSGNRWPENVSFVKKYYERWKEYPNFQSEGAYVALYMLK